MIYVIYSVHLNKNFKYFEYNIFKINLKISKIYRIGYL